MDSSDVKHFKEAEASLPTKYGDFTVSVYKDDAGSDYLVLTKNIDSTKPMLVRIHSSCQTGDVLGSLRCDCGPQLEESLKLLGQSDSGILIYLNQEGRGIGLFNKIKAYALQDQGYDTVEANEQLGFPADSRNYEAAAAILNDLEISKINLLTNNPDKVKQLTEYGIEIVKTIPLEIPPNKFDQKYLVTKKQKLHHKLTLV